MTSSPETPRKVSEGVPSGWDTPPWLRKPNRARVRKVTNRPRAWGLVVQRVPLWPAGHVVVWSLNLGKVRYVWGEVK